MLHVVESPRTRNTPIITDQSQQQKPVETSVSADLHENKINYKNGKKIPPLLLDFDNYYRHKEKLPLHYKPLLQYLENTQVKYYYDNLYERSPIGQPTRAQ